MKRYLDYYESYLSKHPHDADMRFDYARSLEQDGRLSEAIIHYTQAARSGNPAALVALKRLSLVERPDVPADAPPAKRRSRGRLLLLLLLFLLFPDPLSDAGGNGSPLFPSHAEELRPVTQAGELPLIVTGNAVARYREAKGASPASLGALVQSTPENWLSYLPSGSPKACPCLPDDNLLELHYYPAVNQLALARTDGEVLAVYPVASGMPIPFPHSQVQKRVVNPNGGTGGVGTRGLELADNYAIHGTNRPELIGQRDITRGCLRMRNEDIEQLYPYVALGTPFLIKAGTPAPPTFSNGLPPLGGPGLLAAEETPGTVYNWKE